MKTKAATHSKIFLIVGLVATLLLPGFALGQQGGRPTSLEGHIQAETAAFFESLKLEERTRPAEAPAFRMPTRMPGFTCLPTCDPDDGRFLAVASDFVTLSDPDLSLQLAVPAGATSFTIGIFDGDAGEIQPSTGESRWDSGAVPVPFSYSLTADPSGDGTGATVIELLPGMASVPSSILPNDDWANFTITTTPDAQAPSGNFFYRLRIQNLGGATPVVNAFKVRTDGQTLISPTAQPFSYIANFGPSLEDVGTIYPNFVDGSDPTEADGSTYDGSFVFYFEVPQALDELVLWDGDFDRGDVDGINNQDTDDPNTPGAPFVPPFATVDTVPEGVAMGFGSSTGDPPDENDPSGFGIFLVRPPSVRYDLVYPNGSMFSNENPSGNQEWELFVGSTMSATEDYMPAAIPAGTYALAISGVDMQNLNALRIFNRVICVDDMGNPCGPILRLYLVGDTVFADTNGDGVQDFGEPGIEGVQMNLLDGTGTVVATTDTDVNGNYSFEVDAGTHEVEVDSSNFDSGGALEGLMSTTGDAITDTVVDQNVLTYDFGYNGTASIGDYVWYDDNADGINNENPDAGLEGVEIFLTEAGLDGMFGTADDVDAGSQTTDEAGFYEFIDLLPGLYRVDVDESTLPDGLDLTTANEPLDVTLATGDAFVDADFGYVAGQFGSIGDLVWEDKDASGFQDTGEPGLNGVTVTLAGDIDGDGIAEVIRTTVTATVAGVDGYYLFPNLPAADCEADGGGGPVGAPDLIQLREPTVDCAYVVTVDETTLPAGIDDPTADWDGIDTPHVATLILSEGEDNDEIDFGYRGEGQLGDRVWDDLDGDGVQDPGEPGLNGVTVTLRDSGGNVIDTAITSGDGNYTFDTLGADTYTVDVDPSTLPAGYAPTFDLDGTGTANTTDAVLGAGEVREDVDFGYNRLGSIGDRVWNDLDGDGVQDPGEVGINGVTVTLRDSGGVVIGTATTSGDGNYDFPGLTAGDYTVEIDPSTLPAGVAPSFDLDGTGTPNTTGVTLGAGEDREDVDFGYVPLGSIGDRVWNDLDGDGVQDPGEVGINGVTVTLRDSGGVVIGTATTSGDGNYTFPDLAAGDYTVEVDPSTLPAGVTPSFDLDGTGTANTTGVTLGVAEDREDVDFGYAPLGSIGDRVWNDLDGDGVQDPGEVGINGVTVTLRDSGGVVIGTATTSGDGNYSFPGLTAGDYTVEIDPSTLPAGVTPSFDLDGAGTANTTAVTLGVGQDRTDVDFGYEPPRGSIGDRVWDDTNGDGNQDGGEAGINGVTVTLLDGGGNVVATATTSGDGNYTFPNLLPGDYTVVIDPSTLPAGVMPTFDADGIGSPNTTMLTLGSGENRTDIDFGYQADDGDDEICVDEAISDGFGNGSEHAFWLPGIGTDFQFEPDVGVFSRDDVAGTARMSGTVRSAADSTRAFSVDVVFTGLTTVAPAGSPKKELDASAYVENGGPIDPATWEYYTGTSGTLTGLDSLAGAVVTISRRDAAFQVGFGANNKNVNFGGSGWIDYTTVSQPTSGDDLPWEGDGDINVDFVDCPTGECVTIDFEGYAAGTIIDDELAAFGITVSTNSGSHPAMIFDSSNPTGGDHDLGTPNQTFGGPGIGSGGEAGEAGENAVGLGNLLILSEDGDQSDPDDNASGGTFIFTFDDPVLIESVGLVDIDESTNCTLEAFDAGGNLIGGATAQTLGNNSVQTLALGTDGVSTLKVKLTGSGGISSLTVCPDDGGDPPVGDCEPGDVKDSFDSGDFSGNIGSDDWAGPWIENDVAGPGPATGNVWVADGYMFLNDYPNTGTEPSAAREVNLAGAGTATLSFKFDTFSGVDADDEVTVEVSNDGGANWTVLEVITGITGTVTETRTHDISAFASANTQVRFRVTNKYGGSNEAFCLQWVKVLWDCEEPPPVDDCEPGDVKDSFDSNDFNGNIGSDDWAGPWIENDVAGAGPSDGNVWVDDGFMFLNDYPNTGTEPSVAREVDLSGADTATLSFKFDTFSGVDSSDAVTVEISNDGGATWTELEVITGISGTVTETHSFDISAHASADTQVRFKVSNLYGGSNEAFCLQWVKIVWDCD